MKYNWTAAEVRDLVKDWPADAKPPGLDPEIFQNIDRGGYMGASRLERCAALHVASGLEWLASLGDEGDYISLSVDAAGTWIETEFADGHHPTTLHAIASAIMAVAGD